MFPLRLPSLAPAPAAPARPPVSRRGQRLLRLPARRRQPGRSRRSPRAPGRPRKHGPVTLDALASATGRSQYALAWALPELRPGTIPRADPALPGHVRRTVCCRCAARRDAHPFAAVWQPAEISICPSHRIWLGSAAHPRFRRQYDIDGLTEILRPGPHSRLARRRGRQAAINAIAEASRITAFWARHGHYRDRRVPLIRELRGGIPLTGKLSSWDEVTAVVTYPETVDLARVLAMPRWRSPGPSAGDIRHFQQEICGV